MSDNREAMKLKPRKRRDADLLQVGTEMSNVCFNYKQKFGDMLITNDDRKMYQDLWTRWDEAKRAYLRSFKRRKAVTR